MFIAFFGITKSLFAGHLESTDAAGRVPHPSPMWPDAVARASVLHLSFFFSFNSRRLGSIRADATRFVPNQADSARIEPYQPYRVVLANDRNS